MADRYKIGDLVYFHAYADSRNKDAYFLCKGYLLRLPSRENKLCKVVIIAADPKSVLLGDQPNEVRKLLGRKITRKLSQLQSKPTGMMAKLYNSSQTWVELPDKELRKILNSLGRKKK